MNNIISYPLQFQALTNLTHYPNIAKYWDNSVEILAKINRDLNQKFNSTQFSIAVAGSYGRLEASEVSDFDYIILYEEKPENLDEIKMILNQALENLEIPTPNPSGVFSANISIPDMIKNIGGGTDTLPSLAQRMLLLMECRAVYNSVLFENTINQFLENYLTLIQVDSYKEAIFMLNDTIRYFRSICVHYQYSFSKEQDKWVLRNAKLRHSRIVMYAGLLFTILNASKHQTIADNKLDYIKSIIFKSPLERIVSVYQDNNDLGYRKVLSVYDLFLKKINNTSIRKELQADYDDRHNNSHYLELKVTSESLQTELSRFIFSQKHKWTDLIYEYLIF